MVKDQLTQRRTEIIKLPDCSYEFQLFSRPLELTPELAVQYFWLDASAGRRGPKPARQLQSLRNCLDLWWQRICEFGLHKEPLLIQKYLMANCYFLFAASRAQQQIYLDARLRKRDWLPRITGGIQLPLADVTADTVTQQLCALLGGPRPDEREYREAIYWLNGHLTGGVKLFLNDPHGGLVHFLHNAETAWNNRRKRGGDQINRYCLNLMAYGSKLAFYECYANTWIDLVKQLEAEGLDEKSSLYLRFWHHQNFVPQPDGGLPGGLGGLVLALHPVSGFLQTDPLLRGACGEFFQQLTESDHENCTFGAWDSYRKFLSAIVLAANQYGQVRRDDQERRPQYG